MDFDLVASVTFTREQLLYLNYDVMSGWDKNMHVPLMS